MYKKYRIVSLILLFSLVIFMAPSKEVLAVENKKTVLLIYDSYKPYATNVNYLDTVVKAALSTSYNLEIRRNTDVSNNDIQKADYIIVLENEVPSTLVEIREEIHKSNKIYMWIDGKEGINYYDLQTEIFKKFQVKCSNNNLFLMLSDVYPYNDLNELVEKADYLYKEGIPFLIEAMPVFKNEYFDSMKNFAEALRYCVSKGGTVILGAPYIYGNDPSFQELNMNMEIAQKAFVNYWVYPCAITIHNRWLYNNNLKNYINKSDTIIVKDIDNLGVLESTSLSIEGFKNVLIESNVIEGEKDIRNSIISIKGDMSIIDFQKIIQKFKRDRFEFTYPSSLECNLAIGDNRIINNSKGLYLNDSKVNVNRYISNKEYESYFGGEEIVDKKEDGFDLTRINKGIFVITAIGTIVFLIFFLNSLKIDKRKYFK